MQVDTEVELPQLERRTALQRERVQSVTARAGNWIMINRHMARERVNQMATVWIQQLKLWWNSMKQPQPYEY